MRFVYGLIALAILAGGTWLVLGGMKSQTPSTQTLPNTTASTTAPASGVSYDIDTSLSVVKWAGTKPLIPNYVDSGTIGIKQGVLAVDGASGSGTIVMDMTSVHVGATAKSGLEKALEDHLKNGDFFDVATYPTATFLLTSVATRSDTSSKSLYDISGTLTMKGKTNDVTFPAKIYLEDGKLHATASFTLDRTKWGIVFGSKDFFASIGNNAIGNDVKLDLDIVANPKQ